MDNHFKMGIVFPDHLAISQFQVWMPYLSRSPYETCVFAKTCSPNIKRQVSFPVFTLDSGFAIQEVENFKELEFLLYPTNRNKNFNWLLKFPHIKHVFLGHGDSEKHSSSSRIINAYDYAMLSDFDSYRRYGHAGVELGLEKCLFMGVPTQEGIESINGPCHEIRSILYAPTFEGNSSYVNYSSLQKVHALIFSSNFDIIFRPHPGTGKRDNTYKDIMMQYEKSKLSKVDQFNKSDIIICDISGIKNEYLFTGKPIIIPATEKEITKDIATILSTHCYIWDYKKITLNEFIKSISNDKKWKQRIKYRNKKYLACANFDDSLHLFLRQLEFTRKPKFARKVHNMLYAMKFSFFDHASPEHSNPTSAEEEHVMPDTIAEIPNCPICGASCEEAIINKDERIESMYGLLHLFICSQCYFVSFPSNTTKALNPISDRAGKRAGSLEKPGREYQYFANVAKHILKNRKISVCIYGAGNSIDHMHIRKEQNVSECMITDLQNYQNSEFFIDVPNRKFDLVIASEVIEHFENPEENFRHLLSFVSDSGLLLIGTNIHVPGSQLDKLKYPFFLGHCAYWSPEALDTLTSRLGYKLFFMNTSFGGPKKRAIFIFKNEEVLKNLVLLTGKKQVFI